MLCWNGEGEHIFNSVLTIGRQPFCKNDMLYIKLRFIYNDGMHTGTGQRVDEREENLSQSQVFLETKRKKNEKRKKEENKFETAHWSCMRFII